MTHTQTTCGFIVFIKNIDGLRKNLPASCLEQAFSQATQLRYESYTQMAIDAGVFGAPSYVFNGEIFWGQDRLDFVERALAGTDH